MQLWRIFLNSIKLPRKKPMFVLNRTGMDWAIIYLCVLAIIASIPGLLTSDQFDFGLNLVFRLIYFFIFYYIPLLIMLMIGLSGLSLIAQLLAKWQMRKFRFQTLWKLAIYSATWPVIFCTVFAWNIAQWILLLVSSIFIIILLQWMIRLYPKRRIK